MANTVLANMAVRIAANTAQFNQAINQTNSRLAGFEKGVTRLAQTLGITFSTYQIYNWGRQAIETIARFERQMGTVRAITGATGETFKKLEQNALELGRTTEYTASQIAELQVEYGRLGFTTNEILKATKSTIDLATATGENLARSAEIAGSTLRAFSLDAEEMGRVTDVIASSLNKSALALDTFADGMKYVAPVARATGATIEETSALLSVLADAGIKGSQAGTSLRRIFTLLTDLGQPLSKRLDELAKKGITLAAANDEVGLYAQTALLVLTNQKRRVDELTEAFNKANGETERMANIIRDDLIGDFDRLKSATEGVTLATKGGLNPALREITQELTNIVNTFQLLPAFFEQFKIQSTGRSFTFAGFEGLSDRSLDAILQYAETESGKLVTDVLKPITDQTNEQFFDNIKTNMRDFVTALTNEGESLDEVLVLWRRYVQVRLEAKKAEVSEAAGKRAEAVQRAQQEAVEAIANAARERAQANEKAREEAEKELKATIELQKAIFEASQEKELDFSGITESQFGRFGGDSAFASIVDEAASQAVTDFADTYNEAMQQMHDADNRNLESQEQLRASFIQTNETIAAFASSIGDAAAMAIASEQSFEQAFSRIALQIISHYEKVALGAIIANAAKDPTKPGVFSKIAAATIGFAAIKALFAKIGASSSGGSAGGFSPRAVDSANFNQRPLEINLTGNWRLEGSTLVAAIDKAEYQRGRLG